ncbi:hypothetical protein FOMA001_g2245 [Fusarium oxysporum f. sp. matthiolae]|nr:hypothetical protein FOMA001_g2245 [Fusarium oxysporum f. sp. matthiolae]
MASFWEQIPFIGHPLGEFANGIENTVFGGAELAGGALNAVADFTVGKERKERILTEVPTWCVETFGDQNKIVHSANEIIRNADDAPLAELVGEVLRRSPALIDPLSVLQAASKVISNILPEIKRPATKQVDEVIQGSLKLISSAADLVRPELLLETLVKVARTVLAAVLAKVGQLSIIQGGIFSNDINSATLGLVWSNVGELASFFVDLAECAKCYASASSLDGKDGRNSPHGQDNEFDVSQAMNRHAIICQVQRLAKSIIFIFKRMAVPTRFIDIDMTRETTLKSDDHDSGTVLEVRPSGWQRVINPAAAGSWARIPTPLGEELEQLSLGEQPEETPDEKPKVTKEKWLFVNGIATELFWLHLACKKLAKWYSREVTGVYNRGDGILWDLIECAGERDVEGMGRAESQRELIQRTRSSMNAQRKLEEQLRAALGQTGEGKKYAHVVVIAHSQGCLLLRLALEELVTADLPGTGNFRKTMLDRLCVFTFGNPSVDWKLNRDSILNIQRLRNSEQQSKNLDLTFLSSHVLRTEHFANKVDFVAKLGVISEHKQVDSGYAPECVFVNREGDWIGHLFGTQYSLDYNHYRDEHADNDGEVTGDMSWLLACRDGVLVENAIGEFAYIV